MVYLTVGESLDFIKSFDEFKSRILSGSVVGLIFDNGWVILETDGLLGPDITPHLAHCNPLTQCVADILQPWEVLPANVFYIQSELTLKILLLQAGARSLPQPATPARSHYQGEELYLMGRGAGVGLNFLTCVFSEHRPNIKKKFEPLLRRYFETGCFIGWDTAVELDLRRHYAGRHAARQKLSYVEEQMDFSDRLTFNELF